MIKGLFFIFLFTLSSQLAADVKELSRSDRWLRLGHYYPQLGGRYQSESRPGDFFLHDQGHRSPSLELKATIEAMNLNEENELHARCRFPARAMFLKEHGLLDDFEVPCPKLNEFHERLSAKGLSLVFSSYYLDTPASAFGHTLIRFIKNPERAHEERFELLDYAANYAAVVTTDNSFIYALMGMTGGFWGEYAVMPYFYKVREYNDFESRDLWDYELNLSDKELLWIINHLWELSQARFPYLYLSRNCSYHILALINVANPQWKLTDRLKPFVIPVDTIRVLSETEGLVKDVYFRPSKRKVLEAQLDKLTREEQSLVRRAIQLREPSLLLDDQLSSAQLANRFDAALDSIDFLNAAEIVQEDPEVLSWKRKFLLARSRLGVQSDDLSIPMPYDERPDTGHRSSRTTFNWSQSSTLGLGLSLEHRFALHDFLDPLQGHNPGSSMEMGRIRLRVNPADKTRGRSTRLWLDDFALVDVQSLSPLAPFFRKLSWRAYFGGKTLRDRPYEGLFAPAFKIGGGPTIALGPRVILTTFAQLETQYNSRLSSSGLRLGLGPELQIIYRATNRLNILVSGGQNYFFISQDLKRGHHFGFESKYSLSRNLTLNTGVKRHTHSLESLVGLSLYH